MKAQLTPFNFFDRDIWQAEDLGLKPSTTHPAYHFSFVGMRPYWFKTTLKKFIWFQSSTKSMTTCLSYITRLKPFGLFLSDYDQHITPRMISRDIVIQYIGSLTKNLAIGTKRLALFHLRTFHRVVVQENWLPWPKGVLIHVNDLPKCPESMPRFIPEEIIAQLLEQLYRLPEYMQNLLTVLLETGRRISEICMLKVTCLEKDHTGDYLLRVEESKLKKSYLLPISNRCVQVIKRQQQLISDNGYLFPCKLRHRRTPHVTAHGFVTALNKLAKQYLIRDSNGQIWHFQAHQFRHTVGTRMINAGVPQAIVQRYLGHESPDMTSRYAHIHNETLKNEFYKFQQKLVDISGQPYNMTERYKDENWLRHNIMAQVLPNGLCALPFTQKNCPHANACLTCAHFRTSQKHLKQHQTQLASLKEVIKTAEENGWHRQLEMNRRTKDNLEIIISTLKGNDDVQ